MVNRLIQIVLILLLIFTPIVFGSMDLWAFSLMELAILLVIILWIIQSLKLRTPNSRLSSVPGSELRTPNSKLSSVSDSELRTPNSRLSSVPGSELRTPNSKLSSVSDSELRTPNSELSSVSDSELRTPNSRLYIALLFLFLLLVLLQMVPLPSGIIKILSPKTYDLRHFLSIPSPPFELSALSFTLSFVPIATRVEFIKWVALIGLFLFLLHWNLSGKERRVTNQLILVIFLMGVFESLYGMFEFFSGHNQILHLKGLVSSVTGTYVNRNYFAGYLLMAIPLSTGLILSREDFRHHGWRHRLSSMDGKTLLIGFGVIVMILGLLFSASRMGIASLLLSITLISFLFGSFRGGKRFSKVPILILVLALLWAGWIGLDAVISRFFTVSEGFEFRWSFWSSTFQIVKDFPLFGSGLGTFIQVFPRYRSLHLRTFASHAENDFLQLISEVGLVGGVLLLAVFIILLYKAVAGIRSLSHRESQRYIGIGGLVGILALMFHSLVERNIQVPANAFLYTFIWALVLRAPAVAKSWEHRAKKKESSFTQTVSDRSFLS